MLEVVLDRSGEPEIRDVDVVAALCERTSDVFHPQRLDTKKRTEAEALVAGDGP